MGDEVICRRCSVRPAQRNSAHCSACMRAMADEHDGLTAYVTPELREGEGESQMEQDRR